MKKIITLALISAVAITSPVFAQSQNDENIKSDVQSLDKDNNALGKDQHTLNKNRAAKAADKANDESGKQAVDSIKIGVDKTAIEEKKIEKNADEKILEHHKEEIKKDDVPASSN